MLSKEKAIELAKQHPDYRFFRIEGVIFEIYQVAYLDPEFDDDVTHRTWFAFPIKIYEAADD